MWALLQHNWRHIIRTRLLFLLLALALGMQLMALKVSFQGNIYVGDHRIVSWAERESLLIALFVQLFLGTFLSAIYGLWIVPYLHQGQRNQLTFTLPIAKWKFPFAYAGTLLALLLVLHIAMLVSYGLVFGFMALKPSLLPWSMVGICLVLETMAFLVVTFAFALGSMVLGPITTFFGGVFSIFFMQVCGIIFHISDLRKASPNFESVSTARWIYGHLPPLGELAYELWFQYQGTSWQHLQPFLWLSWLAVFGGLFYLRLEYPPRSHPAVDH